MTATINNHEKKEGFSSMSLSYVKFKSLAYK